MLFQHGLQLSISRCKGIVQSWGNAIFATSSALPLSPRFRLPYRLLQRWVLTYQFSFVFRLRVYQRWDKFQPGRSCAPTCRPPTPTCQQRTRTFSICSKPRQVLMTPINVPSHNRYWLVRFHALLTRPVLLSRLLLLSSAQLGCICRNVHYPLNW